TKLKIASSVALVLMLACVGAVLVPRNAPAQDRQQVAVDRQTANPGAARQPAPAKQDAAQPKGGLPAIMLTNVRLSEVNPETGTISAIVGEAKDTTQLVKLPVGKDAEIIIDKKRVKLVVLKPGMRVSLQLVVDGDRLVVAAVLMNAEQYGDALIWHSKAKYDLVIAREFVLEAKDQVQRAAKVLANAQGQDAILAAKENYEKASAALAVAQGQEREAEARLVEAQAAIEAIRPKDDEE